MAFGKEKIKRLSDIVRNEEKQGKLLEKIISKFKPKDEVPEGAKMKLDFKNVEFGEETGLFAAVGRFYSSFTGPVESIAKFLSNFPLVKELEKNLEAGGLKFSAETYLIFASALSLFLGVFTFIILAVSSVSLNNALSLLVSPVIAVIVFILSAVLVLLYPVMKANDRAAQIDRSLPFALRQLSTQLKAGLSFYKSLGSLEKAEYGLLSTELGKVARDLDSGLSTEEALRALERRNKSVGLRKAILQIIRAMRSGGNLSVIISEIADDVSFETRQQIRDFTEKLNFVNILYIMVGVVMPVAIAILAAILQIPLFAGTIPSWFVFAGFGLSVTLMLVILYVTKKMEPAAW